MGVPLVALGVRPPQFDNPLDQYGKAVQLKSMLAQQRLIPGQLEAQQQENQARQLENQQRQNALNDQNAMTAAMRSWDGKDINELPNLLVKHGASATAVMGMKSQIVSQRKAIADADEATLKNTQTQSDIIAGHLEAVKGATDKQGAYDAALTDLEQKGLLKPGQIPHQYPGDEALALQEKQFMGGKQLLEQGIKERETKAKELEAQSRSTSAQTSATRLQAEMPGGPLAAVDKAEMADYLSKNPGKGPADYAKWKSSLAPQAQINVQGGAPGNDLAAAVANGSMKISDVLTARTPLPIRKQFLNQVMAINPQFNSANYDIEKGVMKDFTSGKSAQNLNAFNTAIEHANQLSKATDALDNSDIVGLNKIGNALGYQFGSDKTTNFNVIKNALAGEVSKVFKGGQATDAEIKAVEAPFDAANSPAQLKGAIKNAISLMNSKRDALKQQYEQGLKGQPNFKDESGGTGGGHVISINGKQYRYRSGPTNDLKSYDPI